MSTMMLVMPGHQVETWFRSACDAYPRVPWALERFWKSIRRHDRERYGFVAEDLLKGFFLAGAASEHVDAAWEQIDREFRGRVCGVLSRKYPRGAAEDAWQRAMLGYCKLDESAERLPDGRFPTKLGDFRGDMELFGYLCSQCLKKLIEDYRKERSSFDSWRRGEGKELVDRTTEQAGNAKDQNGDHPAFQKERSPGRSDLWRAQQDQIQQGNQANRELDDELRDPSSAEKLRHWVLVLEQVWQRLRPEDILAVLWVARFQVKGKKSPNKLAAQRMGWRPDQISRAKAGVWAALEGSLLRRDLGQTHLDQSQIRVISNFIEVKAMLWESP